MNKQKLYLKDQGYEAPRAEQVAIANESYLLAASALIGETEDLIENFDTDEGLW